jgi:DNA integrity scanning protein DisA with diadenylate cyclase activity
MFIANKQIRAAACILPVSQKQNIPKSFGLRHRSALGITEYTDAIAIVVSEESGKISWAAGGQFININGKPEELELFLAEETKQF